MSQFSHSTSLPLDTQKNVTLAGGLTCVDGSPWSVGDKISKILIGFNGIRGTYHGSGWEIIMSYSWVTRRRLPTLLTALISPAADKSISADSTGWLCNAMNRGPEAPAGCPALPKGVEELCILRCTTRLADTPRQLSPVIYNQLP
ncbi:uncharacterized protein H6S33_012773 [Morchella sextelata]|uniref:uncharacterized protein n=1 Tax=Morchella sextelata TaxID=1174677 RepID=UPI001D044F54|nr:uncharacterized protein H6S33_012773 [Morchella sextelata]KAH0609287.1 hypothetical protein H6S33_012773 [Morchella sextelata]